MGPEIGEFNWVASKGGPFAFIGAAKSNYWGGDERKSTKHKMPPVGNDYTRAARFGAHEGVISDDDGEIFVFFSEGLTAKLGIIEGNVSIISHEIQGEEAHDIKFESLHFGQLTNKRFLFDFYFSEKSMVLIECANKVKINHLNNINTRTGWHDVIRYNFDGGDIKKYGRYKVYVFKYTN